MLQIEFTLEGRILFGEDGESEIHKVKFGDRKNAFIGDWKIRRKQINKTSFGEHLSKF